MPTQDLELMDLDLDLEIVEISSVRDAVALPESGASSGTSSCGSSSCCGSCSCCCCL
ncbi:thiazolylpeptide-type bacteriocin [Hamadaea tsunoensis]|uniref:thiazolylpeptide-type bacteriocin n=1 Tax=Hamadaea tsunoensis TaxID=53368 RepID=UPI000A006C87|nr:thiazolylpeptide-type bacteriocin [Hamadaea tsunoensis]